MGSPHDRTRHPRNPGRSRIVVPYVEASSRGRHRQPDDRTAAMTPLFLARRRAERFDSLVEGGRRDDVDRATTELLELVGALRTVPEARPRPEFVADLRERLMLAAETELVPAATTPARDDVARLTITP